jgi:hypothetical protein
LAFIILGDFSNAQDHHCSSLATAALGRARNSRPHRRQRTKLRLRLRRITFTGQPGRWCQRLPVPRHLANLQAAARSRAASTYAHESGFYVRQLELQRELGRRLPGGSIEMDFYGGWKKTWGDWASDIGAIYYYYPGTRRGPRRELPRPTQERQDPSAAMSNNWRSTSAAPGMALRQVLLRVSDYFSLPDTNGSRYFDLTANYDMVTAGTSSATSARSSSTTGRTARAAQTPTTPTGKSA